MSRKQMPGLWLCLSDFVPTTALAELVSAIKKTFQNSRTYGEKTQNTTFQNSRTYGEKTLSRIQIQKGASGKSYFMRVRGVSYISLQIYYLS